MYIYRIARDDDVYIGWDEYAGFIVVAASEEEARIIASEADTIDWMFPDFAFCKLIGRACPGIVSGVVLKDFNAG